MEWIINSRDREFEVEFQNDAYSKLENVFSAGVPSSEITIAEVLKDSGYYTAHIGKWHLGKIDGSHPNDQGFDDSLLMEGGLYLPENDQSVVNAKFDNPVDNMVWASSQYSASFNKGHTFTPGGYLTDYYTDEAIKVIMSNKNRPFFLYLAHWAVHNPLQALKTDIDILPSFNTSQPSSIFSYVKS